VISKTTTRKSSSSVWARPVPAARRPSPELSQEVEAALVSYSWPGNVRELRNAMERAIILWPERLLTPEPLPERIAAHATWRLPRLGGDFTLDDAARVLGIDGSTLGRKRKKSEAS
jgi:NtrC-family two-component system response regulator AlgB